MRVKEVKVMMDKERVLRWDMEAMFYLTERYESIGEAVNLMASVVNPMTATKASMTALVDFYVAMLKTDDPAIEHAEVRKILNGLDITELNNAVLQAIGAGSPE